MSAFDPKWTSPRPFQTRQLGWYDAQVSIGVTMRRREFMGILGVAVATPFVAQAQRATPTIGYLSSRSPSNSADIIASFRRGLSEAGFTVGQNVVIESRFADGNFDRLPALAAELVTRNLDVFVATGGTVSAVKAKPVVPRTIPMVFAMGGDPVKLGLVASLNRPGENLTGIAFLVNGLAAKQVELLHQLVPKAPVMGFLVNPKDPNAESDINDAQAAAASFGQKLVIGKASTEEEIDSAFVTFSQQGVAALFIDAEPFLLDQRKKIIALAAERAMPVVSQFRLFAADGGLASYGTSLTEANRLLGVYTGRVLKGTKPADLPVVQSTKFDLVLNLKTAKTLGLSVPDKLLAVADEVIE
jgi:putative tryptophan/tyrosine transport system substrate-binding protein